MNLSEEALRSICSADRNGTPAFFTSKGSITRTELERAVFANGFASLGVAQGDRVLLRITNSVEFAVAFLVRFGPV
jgi:acyl-coenzyme A synthetase/AMP-(fatty) acid ligase